jgi:lipoate-protein ligase A
MVAPHPRPGAVNLAVDEAIARAVAEREAPPTLRLYGWAPPTLTLGRGQPYVDADVAVLRHEGVDLLRRMTGGTAVLNRDELTYTVAVPDGESRLAGTVAESYRPISLALLYALARLGVTGAAAVGRDPATRPNRDVRSPVCFELPSDYEITVGGRKLVGSSQMRIRGAILQHGSLPLTGDIGDIVRYLSAPIDPARVRARALTLRDALGHVVAWPVAADAVLAGFSTTLNLTLASGALLPGERARMDRLLIEKYGDPAWTRRL